MRNVLLSLIAAAPLVAPFGAGSAHAADTVTGEVLDLACYIGKGAKGPAHRRCAQTCAEHGMPLGLLAEDGKVYVLYPKHGKEDGFEAVKKLAGSNAKLTGKFADKDGLLGMEVHEAVAAE